MVSLLIFYVGAITLSFFSYREFKGILEDENEVETNNLFTSGVI